MEDQRGWKGAQQINRPETFLPPLSSAFGETFHHVAAKVRRQDVSRVQSNMEVEALKSKVRELTAAHRRKDEFLAMVSHELRNPLSSIYNAVRILRSQPDEPAARQTIQVLLERQVQQMMRLVDDLLDVSRLAHGGLQLQRERIDLRIVVDHAIQTLLPDINARQHRWTTTSPEAPVWLHADPRRLEQVFVNLIANAVKYTDTGGELAVWIHRRKGEAVIRVRDSGIGIAPNVLPYVFDIFKQADAADRRSKSGLGIGLAVVRNLVQLHGGSVTAASGGCGHGSEFTVRLPIED